MIHEIEQGTDSWKELRKGRITGTRLKEVMGRYSSKLIYEMIAEKYEDKNSYQTSDMAEGVLKEPWAIDKYEEETGQKVTTVGFITLGDNLGLSPDGLVGKKKAVEVKCPSLAKHIEYVVNDKIPSEYKWQVVHYFVVIDELEELDFITYHPKFPLKEMHIINVKRSDFSEDILDAKEKINNFLEKYNQTLAKLL